MGGWGQAKVPLSHVAFNSSGEGERRRRIYLWALVGVIRDLIKRGDFSVRHLQHQYMKALICTISYNYINFDCFVINLLCCSR